MVRKKYNTEEERKEAERGDRRRWREKHAEQVRETTRLWRKNNKQRHKETNQQWRKNNPERAREQSYRKRLAKFGLTLEQYQEMLEQQDGVCKICGKENPNGQRLAVNHNHVTGKIRKLLCAVCNAALSRLEKDRDWGKKAIEYLNEFD